MIRLKVLSLKKKKVPYEDVPWKKKILLNKSHSVPCSESNYLKLI